MNASTIKPFNIAINGFGRIGRNVLRAYIERFCQNPLQLQPLNIVAINDIAEPATLLHLLKYDSTHGRLSAVSDIHIELKTVDLGEKQQHFLLLSQGEFRQKIALIQQPLSLIHI